MAEVISKKCDFVPKKSLEEILSLLRDKTPVTPDPVHNTVSKDKNKIKRQGKQVTHNVNDLDFRNKRSGRLLSRMTKNQHQNRDKPIPTVGLLRGGVNQ
jgi:hypothetical protein